jgi:hypothetical protein
MTSPSYCPECARPIDGADDHRHGRACRHCGATLNVPNDTDPRWINVARLTNLAEAGFLADELCGEGIEVRIYQANDFNALTDRWTASYLIQATPQEASAASARIRGYLVDMEARGETSTDSFGDEEPTAPDFAFLRPVAIVVLAGMASFMLGQKMAGDRDPPRPPRDSLPRVISDIGRPLVTEPSAGLPRHRLSYQPRQRTWYLDTDADGDGRYESRRQFPANAVGW